ncbi:MAG: hypothetical protein ACI8QZ_002856 [Chlamydiales bacterium]|jgi:uncharacterized protein (DUF885 family)
MRTLTLSSLFLACACAATDGPAVRSASSGGLHGLFEAEWEQRLLDDPLHATAVGRREGAHRLPAVDPRALAVQAERDEHTLAQLRALDPDALSDVDRISYEVFEHMLAGRIADHGFGAWQIPFNSDSGFHTNFAQLPREVPLATVTDYENYTARLLAFPAYVDEQIANMRVGIERGMVQPSVVLIGYEATMAAHVVDDVQQSVFHVPFQSFPSAVPAAERTRLLAEGERAIEVGVVAGYQRLLTFFVEEYLPAARESVGCSELPDGLAYYEHLVRFFTTLDTSPAEVHQIGLDEVERIHAEMVAIIENVGFEGDFAAFLEFLRTDPRFYVETPEALLERASRICKRADAALPALFGHLPRQPYGVAPVPAHIAPKYTTGRYVPAAEGSTEPGYYWVNTYALESRPLYVLAALSLHEAVPGHHLQHALAAEQRGVPEFRRFLYLPAFGEGWGLYSERLGLEIGLYEDPYDDFGRLTYEMWRACRLVVDTGLHVQGWSRQRAIDYMAQRTALSLHEVTTEVDRYISWPGQALAYKTGELEIRALRSWAEEQLGPDFDLRAFHDALLENGSVPLSTLRRHIEAFVAERLAECGA